MSLKIRLARGGAKKRPYYRIVIADSREPRDGSFIERIGSYNPMVPHDHPDRLTFNEERARHWLSHGAQPTERVARFFADKGLVKAKARPEQPKQSAPRAKTQERLKAAAEAAAKAAAAPPAEAS